MASREGFLPIALEADGPGDFRDGVLGGLRGGYLMRRSSCSFLGRFCWLGIDEVEAGGDGVGAESAFTLIGGAGAGGIEPCGGACGDCGAEDALAGFDGALPAIAGFL